MLRDALKLALTARVLATAPQLILLFADEAATRRFRTGWPGLALREFGIEIEVVQLPPDMRERVLTAQQRQYR